MCQDPRVAQAGVMDEVKLDLALGRPVVCKLFCSSGPSGEVLKKVN